MATFAPKKATIYRMVMPTHTCPYGIKAKDLLRRQGYEVEAIGYARARKPTRSKPSMGSKRHPRPSSVASG